MNSRRFPPPWTVKPTLGGFVVREIWMVGLGVHSEN
jgi:hypothetical protein